MLYYLMPKWLRCQIFEVLILSPDFGEHLDKDSTTTAYFHCLRQNRATPRIIIAAPGSWTRKYPASFAKNILLELLDGLRSSDDYSNYIWPWNNKLIKTVMRTRFAPYWIFLRTNSTDVKAGLSASMKNQVTLNEVPQMPSALQHSCYNLTNS